MRSKPEPPLRVAYVITSTGIGGAERQVYELASTFRARGWGVGVVSMLPMHSQFLPLSGLGVRLASLEMEKGVPDPRAIGRLARLLRAWRPDVVHGHLAHANFITRLVRPLAPVPRLISTMHSQDEGRQWRYYAYRLTDPLADLTTTVSQMAVDEAVRRHAAARDNVRLVPNGIRTQRYQRDSTLRDRLRDELDLRDCFAWLTVGNLVEAKRHRDLVTAMSTVVAGAPRTRLLVAGAGPLRSELEEQVRDAGLGDVVSFLGLRQDVRALMQAADGFVMSSAWEGLPMVLLEAGASALPTVATDVGGSRDVIEEGSTGYLASPRRPTELAATMLRLMGLAEGERRRMGESARQRVMELFDLERIADRWEALYRA
jgi:glycosyltransferase involved in cell wall biosynthesis